MTAENATLIPSVNQVGVRLLRVAQFMVSCVRAFRVCAGLQGWLVLVASEVVGSTRHLASNKSHAQSGLLLPGAEEQSHVKFHARQRRNHEASRWGAAQNSRTRLRRFSFLVPFTKVPFRANIFTKMHLSNLYQDVSGSVCHVF